MKIVVDKKITKLDGDVEDILSTSQIVEENDGLRVIDTEIAISSNYEISVSSAKEIHIEKQGNTIVNLLNIREFSFIGEDENLDITLTNNNSLETEKAKIKIVVVE